MPFNPNHAIGLLCGVMVGLSILPLQRILEDLGEPGWSVFVPFYNLVVLARAARMSTVQTILLFVPSVNVIILIKVFISIAKKRGRSPMLGVGAACLPFIFLPILAWTKRR